MITGKKFILSGRGIGMRRRARFFVELGATGAAADRGADRPENAPILARAPAGITVYPQDGRRRRRAPRLSGVFDRSSGNPDFAAAPDCRNPPRTALNGRSAARLRVFHGRGGQLRQSSVTAAVTKRCATPGPTGHVNGACATVHVGAVGGNFRPGDGSFLVFEAMKATKA